MLKTATEQLSVAKSQEKNILIMEPKVLILLYSNFKTMGYL